jgi:hypothetical protein
MEILLERFCSKIENDEPDYPNDSTLIAADHPDFGVMIGNALLRGNPIVVFFPDGRECWIPAATARQPRS